MIRDWKNKRDFDDLPKFESVPEPKSDDVKVRVALDFVIADLSPVLASWFLGLSKSERELIIMDAYSKKKMREMDDKYGV